MIAQMIASDSLSTRADDPGETICLVNRPNRGVRDHEHQDI
jgi:hypothetical protein